MNAHSKMKVHMRDMRLYCNAGMEFPVCYANAELLDLDKGRLPTTGDWEKVTCKRCLKRMCTICGAVDEHHYTCPYDPAYKSMADDIRELEDERTLEEVEKLVGD